MPEAEFPDSVNCPYCGAGNAADSEFCGACYKQLHLPPELRAGARALKAMARAGLAAAPAPASGPETAAAPAPAYRLWGRFLLIGGLFYWYTRWLAHDNYFSFLDSVNLAFHEAGHVFLGFFGRFIMTLGGTIFQLAGPAVCLIHLLRRGANIGWQLCLFWIGQSLLNISIYAGDAQAQALPLVGGGEHDWAYLLAETGLIGHTRRVSQAIFAAGSLVIFYSFWLIGRDALAREPFEFGDRHTGGFW